MPASRSPSLSRRKLLATSVATAGAAACASLPSAPALIAPGAPTLRTGETMLRAHGQVLRDPFGWVDTANLDDPAIAAFLRAHRDHAGLTMALLEPLVQSLMVQSTARDPGALSAPPIRIGLWRYRAGSSDGGAWALFRRPLTSEAETLVLSAQPDETVEMWGASDDGAFIAYALRTGPEDGLIRVRNVSEGADLPDRVTCVRVNIDLSRIVWARDGSGFFYSEVNAEGRPWRALFHRLGTDQAEDAVLFTENDRSFFVVVRQTSSGAYALIETTSTTTSEVHLVPLARPSAPLMLVHPRREGVTYDVDGAGDTLLIRTNDTHPNQRLVTARIVAPAVWREVLAPTDEAGLTWHLAYDRHWIVSERANGVDRIRILDRATSAARLIDFPDSVYTAGFDRWSAGPDVNSRADADELIIGYETFVRPKTLFRYSFDAGEVAPLGEARPAKVRAEDYVIARLFATAPDGALIPISLVHRADRAPRDHAGLVLYGYGAYGNAVQATFDAVRLGLLDHGVMFALAHVRGGNDKGGAWARAGQGANRDKPITDFVACAQHLFAQDYVRRGGVVAEGHSAGAWLAAAAVNLAPAEFAGALLHVPYLDVLTDLMDPQSPTAGSEQSVSGNPVTDAAAFERLLRIDPYRTLAHRNMRPLHITGVLTDLRVSWRGIVKYAARAGQAGATPLVVSLAESGSHWAPADQNLAQRWPHERYAFAIGVLRPDFRAAVNEAQVTGRT